MRQPELERESLGISGIEVNPDRWDFLVLTNPADSSDPEGGVADPGTFKEPVGRSDRGVGFPFRHEATLAQWRCKRTLMPQVGRVDGRRPVA